MRFAAVGALVVREGVALAGGACGEALVADVACERFLSGMGTKVLLEGRLLIPTLSTSDVLTNERLFAGVDAEMNGQMCRTKKTLSTLRIRANVRLTSSVVTTEMINQIAFGGKQTSAISMGTCERAFFIVMIVGVENGRSNFCEQFE